LWFCSIHIRCIIQYDIIISRKSFFDLAVEIDYIFKLVENVFVRLLNPALTPRKVGHVGVLLVGSDRMPRCTW
jgi:hypothetical protein